MRYMLLVYSNEADAEAATADQLLSVAQGHRVVMNAARERGVLVAADPLQATRTAKTVRVTNGAVLTTDGPFAETKEQLAGYYLLDCRDIDEAIEWAAKIPTACLGGKGCVEIRPLRELT